MPAESLRPGAVERYMLKRIFNDGPACLCATVILLSGCTNTIHPPDVPTEDRKAYLVDLGRHTRLALGTPDGEFVEYAYGEWLWYARMNDQWWRVPAVLFWPTQGTLGRQVWRAPRAGARFADRYAGLIVLELFADERKVDALIARLDRAFNDRSSHLIRNDIYGLDFVPYHRPYSLIYNSNHAVKEWLEELGFEVTGSGMFAEWEYADQTRPSSNMEDVSLVPRAHPTYEPLFIRFRGKASAEV